MSLENDSLENDSLENDSLETCGLEKDVAPNEELKSVSEPFAIVVMIFFDRMQPQGPTGLLKAPKGSY